jgi:hypothetical protein
VRLSLNRGRVHAACATRRAPWLLLVGVLCLGSMSAAASGGVQTPTLLSWSAPIRIDTSAVEAIACPVTSLCVATDAQGNVLTTIDPSAGAKARWARKKVAQYRPGRFFEAVSCVSTSFCALVGDSGDVTTSTDPATGASAHWATRHIDGNPLYGISCPTATFCAAVDDAGTVFTSSNPAAGAAARWLPSQATQPARWDAITCRSTGFCVVVNSNGELASAADAQAPPVRWLAKDVDGNPAAGSGGALLDISCPSNDLCLAVDNTGSVARSTNPRAAAAADWHVRNILGPDSGGYYESFADISCASPAVCVAVATHGRTDKVVSSTDGGARWSVQIASDTNQFERISCPTPNLCLALDDGSSILVGRTG